MSYSRLIIIGSQYQIVLALRILRLFNEDDITDVILFSSIQGSEDVQHRLYKMGLFRRVMRIENIQESSDLIDKAKDNLKMCFGKADKVSYFQRLGIGYADYNEIWYYNYCSWFYVLDDLCLYNGKKTEWIRFAEGVYTYASFEYGNKEEKKIRKGKFDTITRIRRFLGRHIIDLNAGNVYMSFPELLNMDSRNTYNYHRIPAIESNDKVFNDCVRYIFNYVIEDDYPKYVALASPVDIDGKLTDDQEAKLIIEIADIVGRENLIVKKHPRDKRTIFEDAGIRVVENNIPVEILMVCQGIADRCYLTVVSSGSINMQLDTGMNIRTLFLHELINTRSELFDLLCKRNDELLHRLQAKGICTNSKIINNKAELERYLLNEQVNYED